MGRRSSATTREPYSPTTYGGAQGFRKLPLVSHYPRGLPQYTTRPAPHKYIVKGQRGNHRTVQDPSIPVICAGGLYYAHGRGLGVRRDGMDAPFYPYSDSPSHKGGGSIVFITTDLTRIRDCIGSLAHADQQTPDHVAIRMEHGEVIGRGLTH
jgi:hypothetical protein